jgi:protein SMG5
MPHASNYNLFDNEFLQFIFNKNQIESEQQRTHLNSFEEKENEELQQKLATFQIETDTELSHFNSASSSDNESINNSPHPQSKLQPQPQPNNSKLLDNENAKLLVDLLQTQALLPCIKIFSDWLLCNKKIIQSISQVPTTLWSKLAILLNCIPLEKQISSKDTLICEREKVRNLISQLFASTKSWNSQPPLSEDIHLRSFSALRFEHISLKFDINNLNEFSIRDEHFIRLCHLRRFGYILASLSKAQSSSGRMSSFFEYDLERMVFTAPIINSNSSMHESNNVIENSDDDDEEEEEVNEIVETPQVNVNINVKKSEETTRRNQLMRSMAQLRLEAEISQLESTYDHRTDDSSDQINNTFSPYLVIANETICFNLKSVQDLSKVKKFILIIPLVVIDQLDSIKKESKEARLAIRWLEGQFKQGNRFLRAQTHNETLSSSSNSQNLTLKKRDLSAWQFGQLIDCCKYLQSLGLENDETKGNNKQIMVTLLLNDYGKEIQEKETVINDAKQNGKLGLIIFEFKYTIIL